MTPEVTRRACLLARWVAAGSLSARSRGAARRALADVAPAPNCGRVSATRAEPYRELLRDVRDAPRGDARMDRGVAARRRRRRRRRRASISRRADLRGAAAAVLRARSTRRGTRSSRTAVSPICSAASPASASRSPGSTCGRMRRGIPRRSPRSRALAARRRMASGTKRARVDVPASTSCQPHGR